MGLFTFLRLGRRGVERLGKRASRRLPDVGPGLRMGQTTVTPNRPSVSLSHYFEARLALIVRTMYS